MRIHENGAGAPTGRNEAVGRTDDIATTTPPAAGAAQSSDRLTLSPDAEVLRAALGQAAAQPEIRQEVVDRMRDLMARGELGSDPHKLADALIDGWLSTP